MSHPWFMRLSRDDAAALGGLRLAPGWEVAETSGDLWLRGPAVDESLGRLLAALPALDRFEQKADGCWRRCGERIPSTGPPPLAWQPLCTWLQVTLAPAAWAAETPRPIALRLVASSIEIAAGLLLTTLESWADFARSAPLARLRPLRFAASTEGEVLIEGRPLPPLPGRRYVRHGRIAAPAGWHWQPAVAADLLARRFGVGEQALVLWHLDGTLTRFQAEQFVEASRSAVRATAEAFA
jgi:hypothetical protein